MSSNKKQFRKPTAAATPKGPRKQSPIKGVELLTRGVSSNLMFWSKALKSHLERIYGDFARFMDDDAHYEPPPVDFDEAMLGPEADPYGIYLAQIKTENSERTKEEKELRRNWTPVYALMLAVIGADI